MRITVRMIVGQIDAGVSMETLLDDYPHLEREDIEQALRFWQANVNKHADWGDHDWP
ncbi:DUF433 domain-containing protein [Pelagibacterium sp. HS1C4-1]|nr:DUF433 domain-containing protein [Pelagibacterium xiamenense]